MSDEELGRVRLVSAADITMERAEWCWAGRIPKIGITLLAGGEGLGKSTVAYQVAADLTRGTLPGAHFGVPNNVFIIAAEDSWESVIVPRLKAMNANLGLIHKVDYETVDGRSRELTLPVDIGGLEDRMRAMRSPLIMLDPIMSRIGGALDTHKDADVRLALEPLTAMANRVSASILGIIHINKNGQSSDPLMRIMGSRAFPAVARSILFVTENPDDEDKRIMSHVKCNLGKHQPTLAFSIEGVDVEANGEMIPTSRLVWEGETDMHVSQALVGTNKTQVREAEEWLRDRLEAQGKTQSAEIRKTGLAEGYSVDTLKRAAGRLGVVFHHSGFPRVTTWELPAPAPKLQLVQPDPRH